MSSNRHLVIAVLALAAGLAAGALLAGGRPAAAQTTFTMCGALTIPQASNGADLGGRPPEHPIRIPTGWVPIGGAEYNPTRPAVIVCR